MAAEPAASPQPALSRWSPKLRLDQVSMPRRYLITIATSATNPQQVSLSRSCGIHVPICTLVWVVVISLRVRSVPKSSHNHTYLEERNLSLLKVPERCKRPSSTRAAYRSRSATLFLCAIAKQESFVSGLLNCCS